MNKSAQKILPKKKSNKTATGKKKNGRPVKYTEEFIKKEAIALILYVSSEKIPYLKDFCFRRGYSSEYISRIFVNVEEFRQALLLYKDKFEALIVQGAMTNKFNSYFAFNTLKNCSGWRDKTEVGHSLDEDAAEVLKKYGSDGIEGFRRRVVGAIGGCN